MSEHGLSPTPGDGEDGVFSQEQVRVSLTGAIESPRLIEIDQIFNDSAIAY